MESNFAFYLHIYLYHLVRTDWKNPFAATAKLINLFGQGILNDPNYLFFAGKFREIEIFYNILVNCLFFFAAKTRFWNLALISAKKQHWLDSNTEIRCLQL